MANIKLIFYGSEKSDTKNHKLEVYKNLQNELFIHLSNDLHQCFISLDRDTAIKFSKELRKQISYLEKEG